jgi:hypothetical protein
LEWNGKTIAVYDDSNAFNIDPTGRTSCKGDVHLDDWQWMRSLAQTDVVERLVALRQGKEESPTFTPPATPSVRLTADGTPNKYDTGEWNLAWAKVGTPIATLANGMTAMGGYDVDGSRHCVSIATEHECLFADDDGMISGDWAGQNLEINAAQFASLRALFTGDTLPQLLAIAAAWEDRTPRRYETHAAEAATIGLSPAFAPLVAPAIQNEQWQSEDGTTYTDFAIGDGLTKALISPDGHERPGVHLIIGGSSINDHTEEVITLADVRQLRDNLTALLNDARVKQACISADAGAPRLPDGLLRRGIPGTEPEYRNNDRKHAA